MKRQLFLFALCMLLSVSCRNEQKAPQQEQIDTFSSQPVRKGGDSRTDKRADSGDGVINLLKQRVGRGTSEIVLQRTGYVTSYNKQRRTPNWVAWTLTKDHTYGKEQRSGEFFDEDCDVPEPRATLKDYYNSRYDRGHMCPAGDNKWDGKAMRETFLLTNICPQNHGLNKDDWNDLEMQCRMWARRFGRVTIVCGPLYDGEPRYIGRGKVQVPSGFFKVVYREKPSPAAIAFVFANSGRPQPWREQVCSVDDVEELTGIDFFHQLPDDVEEKVEAEAVSDDW